MIIYHLFINGKYRFKTNSFEEILNTVYEMFKEPSLDYIVDSLISKHEYHYFDYDGNRKVDIVASTFGE